MTTEVPLDKLREHLNIEKMPIVEETITTGVPPVRVTELRTNVKVTPRNTYSSAEFGMTIQLGEVTPEQRKGIINQLMKETIDYAVEEGLKMRDSMVEKGIL